MFTNTAKEWLLMLVLGVTFIFSLVMITRVSLNDELIATNSEVSVAEAIPEDMQNQLRLEKELIQAHAFYKQKIATYETNIKTLNEKIESLQNYQDKAVQLADLEGIQANTDNIMVKATHGIFPPLVANEKQIAIELDQHLANEPYDAEWAETIENQMATVITEELQEDGNELVEATCRTSICRIEISHESELAEQKFLLAVASRNDLINSVADIVSYRISAEESGDRMAHSVFFIAREGEKLPVS